MTREIPLTQGKFAIIDDDDFDIVNKHKWCAVKDGGTFYARTNVLRKGVGILRSACIASFSALSLMTGNKWIIVTAMA